MTHSLWCRSLALLIPWLLSVCAAAGLAADTAAPGPPQVTLEYRFQPGEKLNMDVSHRAVTETTVGATSQATETATDS